MQILKIKVLFFSAVLLFIGCNNHSIEEKIIKNNLSSNILDYSANPKTPESREALAFSDQGAWFAYSFPTEKENFGGFTGPFIMTQENGIWSSKCLSQLNLHNSVTSEHLDWNNFTSSTKSYNSHLEQVFLSKNLKITQKLFFSSAHTALIITDIENISTQNIKLIPIWNGSLFSRNIHLEQKNDLLILKSDLSIAEGIIQTFESKISKIKNTDSTYSINLDAIEIKPNSSKQLLISQTFIFPEYDSQTEQINLDSIVRKPEKFLQLRINEKEDQLEILEKKMDAVWSDSIYKNLLAKTVLTLQNNWRIPAGEIKYAGVFPSYHYIWFHGMWAWDSWKHAVALAQFNTTLAKDQIRAMYDFQQKNGFIPDCIYRDTTIEKHNYRNTKPPLSVWAVWKVFQQDGDLEFVKELYPKIKKQHKWWYQNRDHDKDGICEYGSTDGTLIAAKWESGMDNAVRFDDSEILKNSPTTFSLNQESVDLNAYLFAEKKYLIEMANAIQEKEDAIQFESEAEILKSQIQKQFYDPKTGWFYDTSIDGKTFITTMGCEGWIPLWANAASKEQAEAVKTNMMNPEYFNTLVPFQTLSANHPKFKPDGGYWRGPNWLDQSCFGVVALKNYGFKKEANMATLKLMQNAEGVLENGKSIRENYNPITGEGLESENFSWSAAHYLLLLIDE